jgi:ABC-2 type transport system permease protein
MAFIDRVLNIPVVRRNNVLRTFITAAWLGWQIESNWADPILFAIYSIARPIASVLILVVMYSVITNGATQEPIFAYIYLGNALYILVGQVVSGVSWAVLSDREQYRTTRQLYTTPMDSYFYLMGRGMARLLIGLVSLVITISFGVIAFKLPVSIQSVNWLLFISSTFLGILSLASLGLIVGSLTMMMARHFEQIGDALAAALYLFTGAIFPLEVLPAYWLCIPGHVLAGIGAAGAAGFKYGSVSYLCKFFQHTIDGDFGICDPHFYSSISVCPPVVAASGEGKWLLRYGNVILEIKCPLARCVTTEGERGVKQVVKFINFITCLPILRTCPHICSFFLTLRICGRMIPHSFPDHFIYPQ